MKIARVVTVCAALISTFLSAETVHYKRRSQPEEQLPQPNLENGTDASEITFTTLRPEVATHNPKVHSNVYVGPSKSLIKVRQGRQMPARLRGPTRLKGSRRRRQLQHFATKTGHVARSYELTDNHIENQQIQTVQPPEAFDEGVVHIEPIYRVTKNRNIFDSIIDIVRRVVDPPKSVGPLVGPFHFPGVGDKVYVRLLEPDRPDHLVVRLISHLPATEIESSFDKTIVPPSELLGHSEIPSIEHATIVLPKDVLTSSYKQHGDVSSISTDGLLSSSNNVVQLSKPTNAQGQQAAHVNGLSKGQHILKTYKVGLKQGDLNGNHRIVRHHKRNPVVGHTTNNNHVQSHLNRTHDNKRFQPSSFQYPFDHAYHFHPAVNESSKENFEPFNFQDSEYPRNISTPTEEYYSHQINPFDTFAHSQTSSSTSELQTENGSNEFTENAPRYSIEFASKNMRYLNLDGSIDAAITEDSGEKFKRLEMGPIFPKVSMSLDRQWKPLRRVTVRVKGRREPSTNVKDHKILEERSDNNNNNDNNDDAHGSLQIDRKSSEETVNYPRNLTSHKSTVKLEKQRPSCCLQQKDESKNAKLSSDERKRNETIANSDSTSSEKSTSINGSTKSPLHLQRLQSIRGNATKPRKV